MRIEDEGLQEEVVSISLLSLDSFFDLLVCIDSNHLLSFHLLVHQQFPQRQVGCTGFPADSHDTIWLALNRDIEHHRCPECGSGECKDLAFF